MEAQTIKIVPLFSVDTLTLVAIEISFSPYSLQCICTSFSVESFFFFFFSFYYYYYQFMDKLTLSCCFSTMIHILQLKLKERH